MSAPFKALSSDYYVIPKAQILFQPRGEEGFVLLGDADDVEVTIEVTEQERFTNEEGVRKLVKTVVTEVNPTMSMTLVQMTDRNRALSLLGEPTPYTQTAESGVEKVFEDIIIDRIYKLDHTNVDETTIVVTDGAEAETYVAGEHFLLDALTGMIQIIGKPAGADDDVKIVYDGLAVVAADGLARIGVASKTENRGTIIIRGTNDVGPKTELTLWDVQIRPAGGRSYVGETDFDNIEIEGRIFVDPTKPSGFNVGQERLIEAVGL